MVLTPGNGACRGQQGQARTLAAALCLRLHRQRGQLRAAPSPIRPILCCMAIMAARAGGLADALCVALPAVRLPRPLRRCAGWSGVASSGRCAAGVAQPDFYRAAAGRRLGGIGLTADRPADRARASTCPWDCPPRSLGAADRAGRSDVGARGAMAACSAGVSWQVLPLVAGLFVLVEAIGRTAQSRRLGPQHFSPAASAGFYRPAPRQAW